MSFTLFQFLPLFSGIKWKKPLSSSFFQFLPGVLEEIGFFFPEETQPWLNFNFLALSTAEIQSNILSTFNHLQFVDHSSVTILARPTGLMLTCYTLSCIMVILYNFTLLLLPPEQTLITNPSLGGTTIWTNFNYTYPRTMCSVSSFGE